MVRRINYALSKILKFQATENQMDQQEIKIRQERCVLSIFQHYDLLNIYSKNIYKKDTEEILDYSFLTTYEDEFQEVKKIKQADLAHQLHNEYNIKEKYLKKMKEQYKRAPRYEKYDKIMIKNFLDNENFQLKFSHELDQFLISSIKILLNLHFIYKRQSQFKLSFCYILEASRISNQIVNSQNPDIIDVCAKVSQGLSVFYFESDRNYQAIQLIEDSIFLYMHEIRILNLQISQKKVTKKLERKEKKCYKQLVLALINLTLYLEEIEDFRRLWETIQLADFIVTRYMLQLDDVSKYFRHLYNTCMNKIDQYLEEEEELILIGEQTLGDYCIQNLYKTEIILDKQVLNEKKWYQHLNEEIYDKSLNKYWNKSFNIKLPPKKIILINQFYDLQKSRIDQYNIIESKKSNKNKKQFQEIVDSVQYINKKQPSIQEQQTLFFEQPQKDQKVISDEEKSETMQSTKFDYQQYMIDEDKESKLQQKPNNISFSLDSQSDNSFFNDSFYRAQNENNQQFFQTGSEYDSMFKQTRQMTQQPSTKFRKLKSKNNVLIDYPKKKYKQKTKICKLNKMYFPSDYKPKVITSNNYFSEKLGQNQLQKPNFDLKNPANLNRLYFENLQKKNIDQDKWEYIQLDTHIKNIVETEIERHKSTKYVPMDDVVWKAENNIYKKELFDKKEFGYGRKMVLFKKMEDCYQSPAQNMDNPQIPNDKLEDLENKYLRFQNEVDSLKITSKADYMNTLIQNKLSSQQDAINQILSYQQDYKKKILRDIIFKNRKNKMFNAAGNLKIAYTKYQYYLKELEIQNKKYIDKIEREKQNEINEYQVAETIAFSQGDQKQQINQSQKQLKVGSKKHQKSQSDNQIKNIRISTIKKVHQHDEKNNIDIQQIKQTSKRVFAIFADYNYTEKKNLEQQYQSCRVELGKEKKSKKEETTFNDAFVSKYGQLRDSTSFLGVANTVSLNKEKYISIGDVAIAKLNQTKRRTQASMEINLQLNQ